MDPIAALQQELANLTNAIGDHDAKIGMLKATADQHASEMAALEARLQWIEAKLAVPPPATPIVIAPNWNHPPMPWGAPRPWGFPPR